MNDMDTTTTSRNPKSTSVQSPFRPRINRHIHRLINAAFAARAGAAHMTLDDWRDVEQELKRKIAYEQYQ
jgi:hypothetical protein